MKAEYDFEKKPMSKKKRIIVFLSICLVIILIASFIGIRNYIQRYNDHISMAEYYYEQANYDQAYGEVEHLFPVGNNQEFVDKLKLMKDSYSFLPTDEKLKNPSSEYQSSILSGLLIGLSNVQINKEKFKNLNLSNHFEKIKSKYLSILESQFNVNESIAKELLNASTSEREARITKFGEMAAEKVTKEYVENYVPELEITEKHGKIDGDYIYVSGAVKNNTQNPVYFVKIQVDYLDNSGNVVDSDWTYSNSTDGLQPNAQKYFDVMTRRYGDYTKFKVSIADYQN